MFSSLAKVPVDAGWLLGKAEWPAGHAGHSALPSSLFGNCPWRAPDLAKLATRKKTL